MKYMFSVQKDDEGEGEKALILFDLRKRKYAKGMQKNEAYHSNYKESITRREKTYSNILGWLNKAVYTGQWL